MRNCKRILAVIMLLAITVFAASCGENESGGSKQTGADQTAGKSLADLATADLDGKQVDQSMFSQNKYTLVDIWGTYCNPCIESMPKLEKLHKNYKDKGVGVAGIVIDVQDQSLKTDAEQVKYAKSILKEQGVTYPNIIMSESLVENVIQNVTAVPTAFFVDSKGNIVSEFYTGGRSYEEWQTIIKEEFNL